MENLSKSYKEINIILNLLGQEFSNKIPNSMKDFFIRNEDKEYNPNISLEDVFSQNILPETSSIIAILYINYWTETQEEKEKYMSIIREYDEEKRKEVFNIFDNPKNEIITENNNTIEENIEEKQLIGNVEKPGLKDKIIEILEKLKSLISRK